MIKSKYRQPSALIALRKYNFPLFEILSNLTYLCHREKAKKEKLLKEIEDKKIVRAYEEQKAKSISRFMGFSGLGASSLFGSSGLTGGAPGDSLIDRDALQSNHDLDEVWQNVRNFLDDLTLKGDKREIGRLDRPNLIKFTEACESFDYSKNGVITEANLHTALNRTRCNPLPTKDQLHLLCKALECYTTLNPTQGDDVNYWHFLNGPVHREFVSMNRIFPKIVRICLSLISTSRKPRSPASNSRKIPRRRKKRKSARRKSKKRKSASARSRLTRNLPSSHPAGLKICPLLRRSSRSKRGRMS